MSLIKIFWAGLALICGVSAGSYLYSSDGWVGGLIGFVFGLVTPYLAAKIITLILEVPKRMRLRERKSSNLINENSPSINWYTNLKPLIQELGQLADQYVWVFDETDLSSILPSETKRGESWVIGGEQLRLRADDFPQFNWLVLSAVPLKNVSSLSF